MSWRSYITGKDDTQASPRNPESLTNKVFIIIGQSENAYQLNQLRDYLDNLHNIMPAIEGENYDQHIARQDSLITIAIYQIHESNTPIRLVDNPDVKEIFDQIAQHLIQMNRHEHAPDWAKRVENTKHYKDAALGV